ncbi:hypothetical protein ACIPEN_06740 [Herbaspirillum chlorophenolicum]|uniref:DUF302 domain-containing protein n=1 Tax=Herbaspirillum chlorophenolicum TaxID=211589 RepID=A0ABW8EVP1_9BURK
MRNTAFSFIHVTTATAALTLLAGCATTVRTPTTTSNPKPAEAFSAFTSFELKSIDTSTDCVKQGGADVAMAGIQTRLNTHLSPIVAEWNRKNAGITGRKLVIEPVCSDAKLVGTAKRIFTGPLSGSSAIVMKMRYIDADSGKLIAEPVFYQRAAAMGAAYTFGATDRTMLNRISSLMVDYTRNNYPAAVGGPTGAVDQDVSNTVQE